MSLARGVVVVLVLVAASPADADEQADIQAAKQHFQKAGALFDLERYDDAIKEYETAYQLRNDPSLLFNIAQAHRKARHIEQALHFYRAYLAREPNAQIRERVEQRIRELEQELAAQPAKPPTAQPAKPPTAQPAKPPTAPLAPTTPPSTTTPATTAPTPATTTAARPVRPRLVAGIVIGVAGVGLAVGGIVLSVLSGQAADKLSAADRSHTVYDPTLYSTYQNDAIGGGVMLGVGAAALATGGALIAVDVKRERGARGNLAFNF